MKENYSVRRVVGVGALQGLACGLFTGLLTESVWASVVTGVLFGLIMGFAMRHLYGSTALKGLDRRQRKQVLRAMRRGEPVDDPRLAEPAIEHARAFGRTPFKPTTARIVFGVLLVLGLVAVGFGVAERGWAGLSTGGPLVVISLLLLFVLVPFSARQRQHVEQSAQATAARWSQSTRG